MSKASRAGIMISGVAFSVEPKTKPKKGRALWPTPAANDAKNATLPPSQGKRDTIPGALIRVGENGKLNPVWVEWLMEFPPDWTKAPEGYNE